MPGQLVRLLEKHKGTENEALARSIFRIVSKIRFRLNLFTLYNKEYKISTLLMLDQELPNLFTDLLTLMLLQDEEGKITVAIANSEEIIRLGLMSLSEKVQKGVNDLVAGRLNYLVHFATVKKTFNIIVKHMITILDNPEKFTEVFKLIMMVLPISSKKWELHNKLKAQLNIAQETKEHKDIKMSEKKSNELILTITNKGKSDEWLLIKDLATLWETSEKNASRDALELAKGEWLKEKKDKGKKYYMLETVEK